MTAASPIERGARAGSASSGEPDPSSPDRRLSLALLGRLAVATLIFGGTLYFWRGSDLDSFTPKALTALLAIVYGTSGLEALTLSRFAKRGWLAAPRHIALDLLLVSGVVYLSGGADSSLSFLYGVVILLAALIDGGRLALQTTGVSVLLHTTIGIGLALGYLPLPPDQPIDAPARSLEVLVEALARNVIGLVLVGGLAASLGERLERTRSALSEAEESAAGYALVHEDVVRSLTSGLITLDTERRITTANPAARALLHAGPDSLLGRPLEDFVELRPSSVDDENHERRDAIAHREDGTSFPIGFTTAPLRRANAEILGSFVIFQDLTEIEALRAKAEHANRLATLGVLAAGLAHEIRNPLGSIAGSVELVRDNANLDAEDRSLLDTVLRETDRLNELVTTMLEVGRSAPATRADVEVVPIVNEVVELARRAGSDVTFDVRAEPDEHAKGLVDPQQFRQVLWNLVRNAIQFAPRASTISVWIRREEEALVLEVADEGPGIPEADRAHVFDMFFTRRQHGLGLGLALVKRIVEAHRGEIVILAHEPRGSLFRVRFPDATAPQPT